MQFINENKLYKIIDRFFSVKENLLGELIQNAVRAKADTIHIQIGVEKSDLIPKDKTLYIQDNGTGINYCQALLGIAFSDWDPSVDAQEPAGMGFLQLITNAKTVWVKSVFGEIEIDCDAFINNSDYRHQLIIKKRKRIKTFVGTEILAEMKEHTINFHHSNLALYSGFKACIFFNNQVIKRHNIEELIDETKQKGYPYRLTMYEGNCLFISFQKNFWNRTYDRHINWYGQFIRLPLNDSLDRLIRICYDVQKGTPLTPIYPDRISLIDNDKLKNFKSFLHQFTSAMILEYFLSNKLEDLNRDSVNSQLLNLFYDISTKEESEKIPYLPISYNAFDYSDLSDETIVKKSDLYENVKHFCSETLYLDNTYRFAGDFPLKMIYAKLKYSPILEKLGLTEVTDIFVEEQPRTIINQKPLIVTIRLNNNNESSFSINNALLCDGYNNFHVYGMNSKDIYHNFVTDYDSIIGNDDSFDSIETQRDFAYKDFLDEYETKFSVLSIKHFNFLPESYLIKCIHFEEKQLIVEYDNHERRKYNLEDL